MPPLPHYAFMLWCLVKHRDNFTFTFLRKLSIQDTTVKGTVKYNSEAWILSESCEIL
jgi:hypothetical protein